jgi:hypothetical protein
MVNLNVILQKRIFGSDENRSTEPLPASKMYHAPYIKRHLFENDGGDKV